MAQDTMRQKDTPETAPERPKVLTNADFPAGTLFVAVSDGDQVYAGEDGGPQHGGIGRWRVGRVGPWVSSRGVPLAYRDADTGMIHSGWVEVVTQSAVNPNGTYQCLASEKRYAPNPVEALRSRRQAQAQGFADPLAAPTAKAQQRAQAGKGAVLSGAVKVDTRSPRQA